MSCCKAVQQAREVQREYTKKSPDKVLTSVFIEWRDGNRKTFEALRDTLYQCRGNLTPVKVAFIVFFLAAAFLCVALVLKLLPTSTLVYASLGMSLLILLAIQYMSVWKPTPLVALGMIVFIFVMTIAIAPFLGVLTEHDFKITLAATGSVALIGMVAAISVFHREK